MADNRNIWRRKSWDELVGESNQAVSHLGAFAETIRRFATTTSRFTWVMIGLTIVIAILTAMMVFPELADHLRGLFGLMPLHRKEG